MRRILLLCLSIILVIILFGCSNDSDNSSQTVDGVSEATLARYAQREIREYQGMKLDPAIGPRDNSISGVQYVKISTYELKITGLVDEEKEYSYKDVLNFPSQERLITLYCVEGWDATILWEGVSITELLESAGIDGSASTVIFKSVDNYTTSLPLDVIKDKDLLLAYKSNGIDIPPEMGFPFIVVAENKLGYKWARWVNEIEVSDNEDYKGYWEQFGYPNDADVN